MRGGHLGDLGEEVVVLAVRGLGRRVRGHEAADVLNRFFCDREVELKLDCDADVDVNGAIDFEDLLTVLADWGSCE